MRDFLIRPGRRARLHDRLPSRHGSAAIAIACATLASLAGCAGPAPTPGAAHGAGAAATAPAAAPAPSAPAMREHTSAHDRPAGRGEPLPAEASALADAIRGVPVVLLGELHDNPEHHALRAAALARRLSEGARPALAFEQFDRERQPDIDRSRRERPRDADALIARAGGRGWDWPQYRPFVQLALDHDLPIVAANLSRTDASRVMREGFGAVFDAQTRAALGLDALPAALLASHERAVIDGHCGLLPAAMAGPMARAQVARDVALATAIAPHAARGVVLLTGNAHVRRDVGVPRWLPDALRGDALLAVGLLEKRADGSRSEATPTRAFDRIVTTGAPAREDPCTALRARMPAAPTGAHERAPPPRPSQDR